jgi:hypothetical protein
VTGILIKILAMSPKIDLDALLRTFPVRPALQASLNPQGVFSNVTAK